MESPCIVCINWFILLRMLKTMDSRLRGNDVKRGGNDVLEMGMKLWKMGTKCCGSGGSYFPETDIYLINGVSKPPPAPRRPHPGR